MNNIIKTVRAWQTIQQQIVTDNQSIGLVATMGNLHRGHQSLLEQSVKENAVTVMSLFINPTQFDNPDDLAKYPRTLEQDIKIATDSGVDYIFAPDYAELYPDNYRFRINENIFSQQLCGKSRAGHFSGMLTVVLKLLQLISPHRAYFGEKDYQQLQLIKDMVTAFFINTQIIGCPTIRDDNGVALSSRNNRLTAEQYRLLQHFPALLQSSLSPEMITIKLTELGFIVDYIEQQDNRRFGAVMLGDVRLIDNVKYECSDE